MPDHHLIVIKDNGTGIDIKNIDKIFDPFFTTKKVGEGTGLGLSLSKSIMESHNGDLSIGELNEGAEFILKIPRLEKSENKDKGKEGKEDKWAS
jgi:two-component system NtrC family sensor kinase